MEVLFAGTTGATFSVFRLVTRFGCVVVGDGAVVVGDGAVVVGDGAVVVGDGVVVVVVGDGVVVVGDDSESDCEEYVSSPVVMVNASLIQPSSLLRSNDPTAVQFPGVAHDTDSKPASGVSSCMSSSNTAGCGVSHSPSVDVMVNASWSPELFLKYPTAVQFPREVHDTDSKSASGVSFCMPSPNSAGRASSHSPSVDVMVKASLAGSS